MSDLGKLRWRCRRGVRELDLLLLCYLERGYVKADAGQQQAFSRLLDLEDTELMGYLVGEAVPADAGFAELARGIRELSVGCGKKLLT